MRQLPERGRQGVRSGVPLPRFALALALLAGANAVTVAAASATGSLETTEIAPGIHVHSGHHVTVDDAAGRGDSANIGVVIGRDCVAVIDTGGSLATGRALRARIRELTETRICYVINTHVHFDHVLGNAAFREDQPSYVGHAQLAEAMDANRAFFLENFAQELGPDAGEEAIVTPDRLVEDTLSLDLGDRVLTLTAHPPAHTSQDLTVKDEQTGTLFLGDLLFVERVPVLDGSLKGWLAVLDRLSGDGAPRAVPGHGPASVPWPEGAIAERRYLELLLAETRSAIAEGVFLETAMEQVGRSERGAWELFDAVHPRNVSRAYTELEWE